MSVYNVAREAVNSLKDNEFLVKSNGSKWAGEAPDALSKFIDNLEEFVLEPNFEKLGFYGKFKVDSNLSEDHELYPFLGEDYFFGNFHDVSAVFRFHVTNKEVSGKIKAAIDEALQKPDYKAVAAPLYKGYHVCTVKGERRLASPKVVDWLKNNVYMDDELTRVLFKDAVLEGQYI